MAKPTSWRTCPHCKNRGRKIYHVNKPDKPFECQKCKKKYSPPESFDIRNSETLKEVSVDCLLDLR